MADMLAVQSFKRRAESMPNPKDVVKSVGKLAGWYRSFKPDIKRIAIDNRTLRRIAKMIEEDDRTFFKGTDGSLHYEEFELFEHNQ